MFRAEGTSFRRVLGARARVTGLGVAVLLIGATVAAIEAPTTVHAAPPTISIANANTATTPSTLATMLLEPGETLSGAVTINGDLAFGSTIRGFVRMAPSRTAPPTSGSRVA